MVSVSPAIDTYSLPPGQALNVLIVDDNDFDRQRIRRFSEKADLAILVHETSSLSLMQEAIEKTRFDLILLDYQLADGDGLDALRLLRENTYQNDPGVIMITGNERTDIVLSAFRNGCRDFVSKSNISPEVMRSSMLRTLSSRKERALLEFIPGNIEEHVQSAVVASLTSMKTQNILSKLVSSVHRNDAPQIDVSQQIELEQFFRELEEDDEFRFYH